MSEKQAQDLTVRAYIALTKDALDSTTVDASQATVVDEDFCASNDFLPPAQLHGDDLEVAEDWALQVAAVNSLGMQNGSSRPLRVVAVAEVSGSDLRPASEGFAGEYVLERPLRFDEVISYHVDEPEAAPILIQWLAQNADISNTGGVDSVGETAPAGVADTVEETNNAAVSEIASPVELPDLLWFDGSELAVLRDFLR